MFTRKYTLFILFLFIVIYSLAVASDQFAKEHQALIEEIKYQVKETRSAIGKDTLNIRTLEALSSVPRHEFVPQGQRSFAYENRPLSIGYGQTISQPYIVAIMTDLLNLNSSHKVLEIGTGSGYQAAILGAICNQVYSMEIIPALGKRAKNVLKKQGFANVYTTIADGYYGWEENAPFDAIIVTAAASHVPPPLIKQLKPGGRMIIPVGTRFFVQQLVLITKDVSGKITTKQILPVRFVPLTGDHPEK